MLYVFDPRRVAILLLGGDKTGNNRWYEKFVSIADTLYAEHISNVKNKKERIKTMKTKPYKILRDKMSPKARAASDKKAKAILAEIRLQELRNARQLSQVQLAAKLKINQSSVSKLERQTDMSRVQSRSATLEAATSKGVL